MDRAEEIARRAIEPFRSLFRERAEHLVDGLINSVAGELRGEAGRIIERTNAGLQAAKERGQSFGRPVKMTPEKLAEAKRLIITEDLSVPAAAKRISVSAAALYGALPSGRGALLGDGLPVDEITYPE